MIQLYITGLMSYLRYLCLFAYSGVQDILCFCFAFLRLMYPMLPVSPDCPLLIVVSVVFNVYIYYLQSTIQKT